MKKAFLLLPFLLFVVACNDPTISSSSNEESIIPITNNVATILNLDKDARVTSLKIEDFSILGTGVYVSRTSEFSGENVNNLYRSLLEVELSLAKEDYSTRYGGNMSIYYFGDIKIKFWDGYLFVENKDNPYSGEFYEYQTRLPYEQPDNSYLSLHIDSITATYEGKDVLEEMKSITFNTCWVELDDPTPSFPSVLFDNETIYIINPNIFYFGTQPGTFYGLLDPQTFSFL